MSRESTHDWELIIRNLKLDAMLKHRILPWSPKMSVHLKSTEHCILVFLSLSKKARFTTSKVIKTNVTKSNSVNGFFTFLSQVKLITIDVDIYTEEKDD